MRTGIITLLIALAFLPEMQAAILAVPGSYPSIQAAINASSNGDTIVVSPGTWFENINFRGKNVLLTSLYYLAADTSYITTTVINGSAPSNPDTASCVIFNSGEDSTAILQGFTITGGHGTKWQDIHGAGLYREGGGVVIELSSPTVRHCMISGNFATNTAGVTSSGGGGIRIGDGDPLICANVISHNQGRYGAGIVLNYTGCRIRNNIIIANTGGQEFYGGSGIWVYNNLSTTPKLIENNTIGYNQSSLASGTGGISIWSAANVYIRNNIIGENQPALQVKSIGSTVVAEYNDVQGGIAGIGNIDQLPGFTTQNYLLGDTSPCVDAGDPALIFNDMEDPGNPGHALFPSKGLVRNDMGAYGGPYASLFPPFETITGITKVNTVFKFSIFPNPCSVESTLRTDIILQDATLVIFNALGQKISEIRNISGREVKIRRNGLLPVVYYLSLLQGDTLVLTNVFNISD